MGEHIRSYSPSPPPPPAIPDREDERVGSLNYDIWFAEDENMLPEPLPTVQDIVNCPNVITELSARCTKRVSDCYVAKYGAEVSILEAQNARFVSQHTNIRVPRIFAVYRRQVPSRRAMVDVIYIVMENIAGETLESKWNSITEEKKHDIASLLKNAFTDLRKLRNSSSSIESIGNLSLQDSIFITYYPQKEIHGPFETEADFISGLIAMYRSTCGDRMAHKADYYDRVLPRILTSNEPTVFTHNDLQRKNIILVPNGDVAIIDWAASGWYPSYWEYSTALFACGSWNDDWHRYIPEIVEETPEQSIWLNTLRLEMWS